MICSFYTVHAQQQQTDPAQKSSKIIKDINNPFEGNAASLNFKLIFQAIKLYAHFKHLDYTI